MAYNADEVMNIDLGVQGENLARTIEFDVGTFLQKWPDAKISLLVKRKRDSQPYVAVTDLKNNILYWPVTAADTEYAGEGKLEIRVISGEVVAKSATGKFTVQASMAGSEAETPEASQGWVNQVLTAGNDHGYEDGQPHCGPRTDAQTQARRGLCSCFHRQGRYASLAGSAGQLLQRTDPA